jgi:type II secretory pathway pseudopilin PulG
MKVPSRSHTRPAAFTLLEMTVVIMVLLALIGMGLFSSNKYNEWKRGRTASETLRSVYAAQRLFLADNPTAVVANLVEANITPYLPNVANPPPATLALALQPVTSLTGAALFFNINTVPPTLSLAAGGAPYEPNGSTPTDSLWDVGQP